MTAKNALLDINDLVIEGWSEERWQTIVHGVSLDLKRGEVLGLIGESGAGKSTIGLAAIKEITGTMQKAALYITHDLAVVAQVAHRIMVLRYGKEVETGETRDMLKNPKETYTRDLLSVRSHRKDRPGTEEQEVILEIEDLEATCTGKDKVLEDINLRVRRGRTVALVGESGSGKSTLAKVVTGLLPPIKGRTIFKGQDLPHELNRRTKEHLRSMQMIYQMPDTALNPRHKVRKVLGRPLEFYFGMKGQEAEDRIRELLTKIDLAPDKVIDRLSTELSGGEKQRVCIARALAARPDLIICDEVTSALDQLVAEGILKLLEELQKELMTPPHHEYTEKLLASVPEMDPDWLDHLLQDRLSTFV